MKCFLTHPNDECHSVLKSCEEECTLITMRNDISKELDIPKELLGDPDGRMVELLLRMPLTRQPKKND